MRNFRHKKKIAFAAAGLVGAVWFAATTRKTTQAAVTPTPRVVLQPVAAVETTPIVPAEIAEAARGKDWMDSANKTDW